MSALSSVLQGGGRLTPGVTSYPVRVRRGRKAEDTVRVKELTWW